MRERYSLNPGIVIPIVVCVFVISGDDALFYSICSLLCALELSFCILELDPGEFRNPLKFLIVKNVFLRILLGRSPLYPDNKQIIGQWGARR